MTDEEERHGRSEDSSDWVLRFCEMIEERMDDTGTLRKPERTFFEYLNAFTIETRN
jgi:hypothetical protein